MAKEIILSKEGGFPTLQATSASRNEVKLISTSNFLGREINVYGSFENPLFKAKDVAEWIGHTNPSKMVSDADLGVDECVTVTLSTLTNSYSALMLTEDGLYEVLMQSHKPIAKDFKKGVKEILETIRKTGRYELSIPSYQIENPIERAEKWIEEEKVRQQLQIENKKQKEQINVQNEQISEMSEAIIEMKSKTEYLDIILKSKGTVTVTR